MWVLEETVLLRVAFAQRVFGPLFVLLCEYFFLWPTHLLVSHPWGGTMLLRVAFAQCAFGMLFVLLCVRSSLGLLACLSTHYVGGCG